MQEMEIDTGHETGRILTLTTWMICLLSCLQGEAIRSRLMLKGLPLESRSKCYMSVGENWGTFGYGNFPLGLILFSQCTFCTCWEVVSKPVTSIFCLLGSPLQEIVRDSDHHKNKHFPLPSVLALDYYRGTVLYRHVFLQGCAQHHCHVLVLSCTWLFLLFYHIPPRHSTVCITHFFYYSVFFSC